MLPWTQKRKLAQPKSSLDFFNQCLVHMYSTDVIFFLQCHFCSTVFLTNITRLLRVQVNAIFNVLIITSDTFFISYTFMLFFSYNIIRLICASRVTCTSNLNMYCYLLCDSLYDHRKNIFTLWYKRSVYLSFLVSFDLNHLITSHRTHNVVTTSL